MNPRFEHGDTYPYVIVATERGGEMLYSIIGPGLDEGASAPRERAHAEAIARKLSDMHWQAVARSAQAAARPVKTLGDYLHNRYGVQ